MRTFVFFICLFIPVALMAQGNTTAEPSQWSQIVAWVVGAVGTLFGGTKIVTWIKDLLKTKSAAIANTGKELVEFYDEIDDVFDAGGEVIKESEEALAKIATALEDGTLTAEELVSSKDELLDVVDAVKTLLVEAREVPEAYRELAESAKSIFAKA